MKPSRIAEAIAFTVLLILLVGIFIPTVSSHTPNPERIITKGTIARFQEAIELYRVEYGIYPELKKKELVDAVSGDNPRRIRFWEPKTEEKRLLRSSIAGDINENGDLIDGWLNPFLWKTSENGQTLTLVSKGKNGIYQNEDEESDDIHFTLIQARNP